VADTIRTKTGARIFAAGLRCGIRRCNQVQTGFGRPSAPFAVTARTKVHLGQLGDHRFLTVFANASGSFGRDAERVGNVSARNTLLAHLNNLPVPHSSRLHRFSRQNNQGSIRALEILRPELDSPGDVHNPALPVGRSRAHAKTIGSVS
jgi:hypothetical protein